jgi:ubiquinone/menaquinone biosynthesis C-methylase UbiE
MDYRKPVVFGENWSPSRYRVLPYFAYERQILKADGQQKVLDLGCASGWNMSRFLQYGLQKEQLFGLDIVPERVQLAAQFGQVLLSSGLQLPFADESFAVIYIQHVLHHIGDVQQALAEIRRCLQPGGVLFLIETVEDSPLIRWGRAVYPHWMGDEITAPFRLRGLQYALLRAGFGVNTAVPYSVLFWVWEILPDQYPFMEKLTPLFVKLEEKLYPWAKQYSAHAFLIATKQ